MDVVKKVGADHVFNHREKGYLNNAVAAIGGHGFNVVLENLANVNLGADLTVLNQQARVAVSYLKLLTFLLWLCKKGFYFNRPFSPLERFSFLFCTPSFRICRSDFRGVENIMSPGYWSPPSSR
jgi:hypothetical protein